MKMDGKKNMILGIDPGSITTGYGLITQWGQKIQFISCGCIRTKGSDLPLRLQIIFSDLQQLIEQYQPDEMAIENVFMANNPDSALKLGQARGAAICATTSHHIPVHEYTANQIKQSVVGKGHADKKQVQHMVKILLSLNDTPQADAADALAVAICHANTRNTMQAFTNANQSNKQLDIMRSISGRRKRRFVTPRAKSL